MNVLFHRSNPEAKLPEYGSAEASGMDVFSIEDQIIYPNDVIAIDTGLVLAHIDVGYEIQVRPRSGNTLKKLFTVSNSPGTIDSDYRGPIKVLLHLIGDNMLTIAKGDKIAQLIVCPVIRCTPLFGKITESERGAKGFGSTGS